MRVNTAHRTPWAALGRAALRAARWSATLAALVGALVGVHFTWRALQTSERLRVHHIDVQGTHRTTRDEVLTYTGVKLGDRIFHLDLDGMALRLRRHPWVRAVTVRRRLPDGLSIIVTEHAPAIVVSLGGLYLADEDGELFKRFSATDGLSLPVLTGLGAEEATSRSEASALLLKSGLTLAHAVVDRQADLGRLEEVHWDENLGWSVLTATGVSQRFGAQGPLWIHLGMQPHGRLDNAAAAVTAAREMRRTPAEVFVDGNKHPGRVHIRFAEDRLGALPSWQHDAASGGGGSARDA